MALDDGRSVALTSYFVACEGPARGRCLVDCVTYGCRLASSACDIDSGFTLRGANFWLSSFEYRAFCRKILGRHTTSSPYVLSGRWSK